MSLDPYSVLGVSRTASADEIRSAYRRLVKEAHPDLNPQNRAAAEERFKKIQSAYDIVGDPQRRESFDRGDIDAQGNPRAPFGGGFGGAGPGAGRARSSMPDEDLSDFFESMLGGGFGGGKARGGFRMRGRDLQIALEIDLLESIKGGTKAVTLSDGRVLRVNIPAGIETGQTLRLPGQGEPGVGGGPPGDALAEVKVKPHPFFDRDGADLRLDLPISLVEAVEGGKVQVPTPDGAVQMTVPAGSNSGVVLRLRGKGAFASGRRGDLLVRLMITLPDVKDGDLRHFLEGWAGRGRVPSRPESS